MPGTMIGNINFTPDMSRVFLWQYEDAAKLNAILQSEVNFCVNSIGKLWENWLTEFFDINTATEQGLYLWGALLGVQRGTYVEGGEEKTISLEIYRRMLKARFFNFGSHGTVPEINRYLRMVLDGKPIFCRDNYDMTVTILCYVPLTAEEIAVLLSEDFLPLPCGVKLNIITVAPDEILGFKDSELQTLDNGVFVEFN